VCRAAVLSPDDPDESPFGVEGRQMDIDLGGIRPNWDFLPPGVRSMFESAAGTALMIGLGICAIGFIIAGVRLLFARTHGMYGAGADAKTQFLWAVVGTLVVASSVSLVVWLAGQAVTPSTPEPSIQESSD
jgi:hypothetical protein